MSSRQHTTSQTCTGSGQSCYKVAAVVTDLMERLLRETAEGGMVRLDDALKIMKLVGRGTYELDLAFDAQEKNCRQGFGPQRDKASSRNDPFHRLMVRPFETLLSGDPAPYPRPFLGNYFEVLEAAYGEKYTEYDRHSRAQLQALLVAHGHNLSWDTFYAEARVSQILVHALRRLLRFLETPAGQWVWVQSMSRQIPSGARPTVEQSDLVREALGYTLRGLDPAGAPS